MARVKGGDVVVQLMDTVAQLEATAKLHAEQLEAMARLGMETSARLAGLGTYTFALGSQVHDLSKRMDDMSTRMDGFANGLDSLASRITALEEDVEAQAQNLVEASKTARTSVQQLARLARLSGELADGSERRFVTLEERLTALEKKSG